MAITVLENYLVDGIIREEDKTKWNWETFIKIPKITNDNLNELLKCLKIHPKTKSVTLDKHNKEIVKRNGVRLTPKAFFGQVVFNNKADKEGFHKLRDKPKVEDGKEYFYDILFELWEVNKDDHDVNGIIDIIKKYYLETVKDKPIQKSKKKIKSKYSENEVNATTPENELKNTDDKSKKKDKKKVATQRFMTIQNKHFNKIEELANLSNTTPSRILERYFNWSLDVFYQNQKEIYEKANDSLPSFENEK